ncbi:helix-turn-helix domain-containing protein [Pendulispora albinea]|uniref:AraC family transcriptional regulator n=1 Tax=Pendulispora albinea TaxID=2741071 RepID=A0ABZ2LZC7_9BACT
MKLRAHPLPGVEVTRVEGDTHLWIGHSTHYGLSLVYEGAFDFWYRKHVATHVPGRLKLKEPGEIHRDVRVHAPVTAQSVALSPDLVEGVARGLGLKGVPHFAAAVTQGHGRAERLGLRLHACLGAAAPDRLEAESLLVEALEAIWADYGEVGVARAARGADRGGGAAARVREYLHAHWQDNVSLDELSVRVGRNKFSLLREFRAEYGLPPYEYLTHLRVARARLLLGAGRRASEVALEVGLYDQSQLHRHFTRIVGVTPGRFVKNAQDRARRRR